jgi:hypothetical protein
LTPQPDDRKAHLSVVVLLLCGIVNRRAPGARRTRSLRRTRSRCRRRGQPPAFIQLHRGLASILDRVVRKAPGCSLPLGRTRDDLHVAWHGLLTARNDAAHGGIWTEQDEVTAIEFEVVAAMRALLPPVVGPIAETLTTSGPDAAKAAFHRLATVEPAEFDLDDEGFVDTVWGAIELHRTSLVCAPASVDRLASELIRCLDDDQMGLSGRRASRSGEESSPTRPRPRRREPRCRADHERPPLGMTRRATGALSTGCPLGRSVARAQSPPNESVTTRCKTRSTITFPACQGRVLSGGRGIRNHEDAHALRTW